MAICKDCISHDVCEEHKTLMLTVDNNFELIYQNCVQISCHNFKDKSRFVEVVHSKWIKTNNERRCPVCDFFYMTNGTTVYNLCPMCGAIMDGERKENGNETLHRG